MKLFTLKAKQKTKVEVIGTTPAPEKKAINDSYEGKAITIVALSNGTCGISVDGKEAGYVSGEIAVTVHGDVELVSTMSGKITVTGNVEDIDTQSGSVECRDVTGDIDTMSGSVRCSKVGGSIETMSGDVTVK
jgi:uncharacterized protein (DUF1786 family)